MKAFLSHASADNPLATKIFRRLRDQAVSVWFDRFELRPGDSLLQKIAAGIERSDFLLVLVTPASVDSKWVQEEVAIARTMEINGGGPTVIPIVARGCTVPAILAAKIYVSVDDDGNGIENVFPAIFRDVYCLDIPLTGDALAPDQRAISDALYEFVRSDKQRLFVRIDNRHFITQVEALIAKTLDDPALPPAVADQVRRVSKLFHIELPMFWCNLAQLLADALNSLFDHEGKDLDAVDMAVKLTERSLKFAQASLVKHLMGAVFSQTALLHGFPALAAYIARFETVTDDKAVTRELCEIAPHYELARCDLKGDAQKHILDQKLLFPTVLDSTDALMLRTTCTPESLIERYTWYTTCLPQVLRRALHWTALREGKPLQELPYRIGWQGADYTLIGLS